MRKPSIFIGGFLVGVLGGAAFSVAAVKFDRLGIEKTAAALLVKGVGLILAILFAKPIIIATLRLACVPLPTLSETESAVGKTIGFIERFLAYSFVLDGSDNAISMLIAAKGIYRIHELGIGGEPSKSANDNIIK